MYLCCLLSQLSSLSIEDQEDTQFPFAMRDLPPVSQPGERHQTPGQQAPVTRQAEGTATNGRLPSLPGTPPLPRSIPCRTPGSPRVPHRPNRVRSDAEFQPVSLRRQLVSQVSMDCPLSPASRPRSPWGCFDPYDSPEVRFCVLLLPVHLYDGCVSTLFYVIVCCHVVCFCDVVLFECLEIEKMPMEKLTE